MLPARRFMPRVLPKAGVAALSLAVALSPVIAWGTVATERQVGDEFARQARFGIPLIDDYEINGFITEVGNRFVDTLGSQPFDYEFFIVNEDSINAFAVPGGKIFVHAGLIARAANEAELAGVVGHEVAHAHAHHSMRQQEKAKASNYASLLGMFLTFINPVLGQAAIAAASVQQLKYQRDFEREADFLGIEFAEKAGYEPEAMLGLLRKIYDEQKVNPTVVPPYFLSHPLTGERMAYLEAALGKTEWELETAPADWRYERARAISRANAQTRREAIPPYERRLAAATPGERPKALELIGVLMVHGQDWQLARRYLEQAEEAGRQVDRELGRAYLRTGELAGARERLERAVKRAPGDWNAAADLGEVLHQMGEHDSAVQELERAHQLYPYKPQLLQTLGRALDKAGRTGAGFYYYGIAAEMMGQPGQALLYYTKADAAITADDPLVVALDRRRRMLEEQSSNTPPAAPGSQRPQGRLKAQGSSMIPVLEEYAGTIAATESRTGSGAVR